MNVKRYLIASIVVYIIFMGLDFIIHGPILGKTYMTLSSLWRPDMMSIMWIMWISSLIFSFLFVYIFTRGYENRGILEGVRFGILMGIFISLINTVGGYVIYPIPLSLAAQWFIYGMIEFIIAGIAAALIYRPKSS